MLFFLLKSIIILLVILVILFLFVPFYLVVEYDKDSITDDMKLFVSYFGLRFNLKPKKKSEKKDDEELKDLEEKEKFSITKFKAEFDKYVDIFNEYKDEFTTIMDFLSNRAIYFKIIEYTLNFGFGDAMMTGIMTGSINAVVYNILSIIHNHCTLNEFKININPDFDNTKYETHFKCILKIKSVHIIFIAFRILRIYFKINKGNKED